MTRNLLPIVDYEQQKNRLTVVDLLQVTFPAPVGVKYWSNHPIIYDGHQYEPRVIEIGNWSRSINPETDSVSITLGNADGELTAIYNTIEPEFAELKLIRYFPDIDEAIDPLWVGWGGVMKPTEQQVDWDVRFGFRGFMHRGIRVLSANCWKIFRDGVYCPYNGTSIGASDTLSAFLPIDSPTCEVTTPAMFQPMDVIKIDNELMVVLDIAGNTLDLERGYAESAQSSHGNGSTITFNSCLKDVAACKRRGMNGPPELVNGKRYFGGWSRVPSVDFSGVLSVDWFKTVLFHAVAPPWFMPRKHWHKYYTQSSVANEGVFGLTIPVIYGVYRLKEIPAAAMADAKEFKHSLFVLSEGPITAIAANATFVAGLPVDNIPNPNNSDFDVRKHDSCVIWWGNIGQRSAYGVMSNKTADTYEENPYLFCNEDGDGCSFSDIAVVRIRTEEGGSDFTTDMPTLDTQIVGRATRTIQSYIQSNPALVTGYPDPIQVATDYIVNGKFGARLDISNVDMDAADNESAYCRVLVNPVGSPVRQLDGTVVVGPQDIPIFHSAKNDWVAVEFNENVANGSLAGRTIVISGQTRYILHNYTRGKAEPATDSREWRMGFKEDHEFANPAVIIEVNAEWLEGDLPTNGDSVTITGYTGEARAQRFLFNGSINDDDSVEKQLAMILQNCHGYYITRGKQIVLKIKKAEDLNTIDALPWLTDYGNDRNILRENGVSTVEVSRRSTLEGIPNQIDVSYFDPVNGFEETTIHVYGDDLQTLVGEVLGGNKTRMVVASSLKLIGTTSKDQAMRLGALALREAAMERDGVTFKMSLKDSLALEPGDVRRFDTTYVANAEDKQLSKRMPYIRITKIEETSKFIATIEAHRYEVGAYDDSYINLTDLNAGYAENPANYPANTIPLVPAELIEISKDGTVFSVVKAGVTYPA